MWAELLTMRLVEGAANADPVLFVGSDADLQARFSASSAPLQCYARVSESRQVRVSANRGHHILPGGKSASCSPSEPEAFEPRKSRPGMRLKQPKLPGRHTLVHRWTGHGSDRLDAVA